MTNPCEKCKRLTCPEHCWPRQDYLRALQKRRHQDEKTRKSVLAVR